MAEKKKAKRANPVDRSYRPVARPNRTIDLTPNAEEGDQVLIGKKKPQKMAAGGKLKMVKKGGKKVPSFAADGVGKMAKGGMARGMGAATRGGKFTKNG